MPTCARDGDALKLRRTRETKDRPAHLLLFCGPALLEVWAAARSGLLLFLVTPVLGFLACECGTHSLAGLPQIKSSFDVSPLGMLLAVLRVSALLILPLGILPLLWREHQARRYIIVPITRLLTGTPPKVFGRSLDFIPWFIATTALSAASQADLVTNGLFTARYLKQLTHDNSAEDMWNQWVSRSIFPYLDKIPLFVVVLGGWLLMMLQALYGIRGSWSPTGKDLCNEPLEYRLLDQEDDDNQTYATATDNRANHGKAMLRLMECCRMGSALGLLRTGLSKQYALNEQGRYQIPDAAGGALQNVMARVLCFRILETAYQINLQSALLVCNRARDPEHALDLLTCASIVISTFMGLYNVVGDAALAYHLKNQILKINIEDNLKAHLQNDCPDFTCKPEKGDALWKALQLGNWSEEDVRKKVEFSDAVQIYNIRIDKWLGTSAVVSNGLYRKGTVQHTYIMFLVLVSIWTLIVGATTVRTVMSVYTCPDGLWNFSGGCRNF